MMIAAIAIGMFALAAISTAYTVLDRAIDRSYLSTNPATAWIDVDRLDAEVLAGVRQQAGIAWAEASGRVFGRIEVRPREWLPLLLFVLPDLAAQRISVVRLDAGQWPADASGIVLERTALSLANAAVGRAVTVQSPNGAPQALTVTGVVHDPSLAPAWQQQTVYGYITPATLRRLGEVADLHVLKVVATRPDADAAATDRIVVGAADWIRRSGAGVGEIRIPPRHHPHQAQMMRLARMLLVFSVFTLILSAILTSTLTAGILTPQVRQIGVMKAVGATSGQLVRLYGSLVAALGAVAVSVGLPLGVLAGRALATIVARNQNLHLGSLSLSGWLYAGEVVVGVGLPLALALVPIATSSRRTVLDSLNDHGVEPPSLNAGRLARWASRCVARDPALVLAIRNSVRRRGRLALTVGLLAAAGALFITSLNLKAAWEGNLFDATSERHYGAEFEFANPEPATSVVATVAGMPGVTHVETFSDTPAALARPDGLSVVRTYPDGGHGSLRLDAMPTDSAFVSHSIVAGHRLSQSAPDEALLNEPALTFFPGVAIGDPIHVTARGRPVTLRVAGIVREHLAGPTIHTSSDAYARSIGKPGMTDGLRVSFERMDEESVVNATADVERVLSLAGYRVADSTSKADLGRALGGHLFTLIFVLIQMSILMALVGVLGLSASVSTSVLERRRELAVMRAIGAPKAAIFRSVMAEGAFLGLLSVVFASLISVPVSMLVGQLVGPSTTGSVFSVGWSLYAIPLWLVIVLLSAAIASEHPASTASNVTIREALTYQ